MIEPPESFARRLDRLTAAKVQHEIERRRRMVPIAASVKLARCRGRKRPIPRQHILFRLWAATRRFCARREPGPFDWPVFGLCCIVILLLPLWLFYDLGRW